MTTHAKTRFLLVSDTHSAAPNLLAKYALRDPLPKADVLVHSGDLTRRGKIPEYQETLRLLARFDAELKLVIAGNHDLSLDRNYRHYGTPLPEVQDERNKAERLWKGEEAIEAGVTYLEEGMHTFALKSGARLNVYASPYTPEFCNWAFPYERNEDRFNSAKQCSTGTVSVAKNPVPDFPNVDLIVTHGPGEGHLGEVRRGEDAGCPRLLHALRRVKPRLHCFGHIHEGWGAHLVKWARHPGDDDQTTHVEERAVSDRPAFLDVSSSSASRLAHGLDTLLVNASIMDVEYGPRQRPWLVDLDLPVHAPAR